MEYYDSIIMSEIQETVISIKSNKAPGPDGISIEFLKHFSTILFFIIILIHISIMITLMVLNAFFTYSTNFEMVSSLMTKARLPFHPTPK